MRHYLRQVLASSPLMTNAVIMQSASSIRIIGRDRAELDDK